jgi:myo-inositol-1-phosphate synthase
MKSPHTQRPDDEAREATEKFIAKYAGKAAGTKPKGRRARKAAAAAEAPGAAEA